MLYEWVADFERSGQTRVIERARKEGSRRLTGRYRYMNQVPLRDSDDALWMDAAYRAARAACGPPAEHFLNLCGLCFSIFPSRVGRI
jgi:hypothetical protein